MICNVCGSNEWVPRRCYRGADKYEKFVGIPEPVFRQWMRCNRCGLFKCHHNYDTDLLKPIYTNGYRSEEFRNESIEETFQKVAKLPPDESENIYRVRWLKDRVSPTTLLDIGSGFGIFPYTMKWHGFDATCWEPNIDSAKFIENKLNLRTFCDFFGPIVGERWKIVSMVHVLEHVKDPEGFLFWGREICNGKLFVEVPDAIEFEYLPREHDEFNSCHLYFFTVASLVRLVDASGFQVTDVHRVRTKTRNLSRIMLLADVR
jgi:hypothetical protein